MVGGRNNKGFRAFCVGIKTQACKMTEWGHQMLHKTDLQFLRGASQTWNLDKTWTSCLVSSRYCAEISADSEDLCLRFDRFYNWNDSRGSRSVSHGSLQNITFNHNAAIKRGRNDVKNSFEAIHDTPIGQNETLQKQRDTFVAGKGFMIKNPQWHIEIYAWIIDDSTRSREC